MQWLRDSKACISEAKDLYTLIEDAMSKELSDIELDRIKVKIKNLFENCRSPLDYVANYIHETYCRGNKDNLYFPIRSPKKRFVNYMNTSYFDLKKSNFSLYNLLESMQPYHPDYKWLSDLSKLANHNKRQNLSRQMNNTNIYNASVSVNGATFGNLTITNSGCYPLVIDDQAITSLKSASENPDIEYFNGQFEYEYYFSDLNLPVLTTLKTIINGVNSIIEDIAIEVK